MITYLIIIPIFFAAMLGYFRIADHFNIIDKPNERSSHTSLVIRGGGIIYLVAALVAFFMEPTSWAALLGLLIIGAISFLDDRMNISSRLRILIHLIAVTLLFWMTNVYTIIPWYFIVMAYIFVIGIINAYNFMDGINGITGLYSLVVLCGLAYINDYQVSFVHPDLIYLPIAATLVFLFFNFRKKAKCFAGDVGSVTIAFWLVWLLLSLMLKTNNLIYILFLAVYGVDSVFTIIHRLIRKENIFLAHRLHFYQILANDQKIPHLLVATVYALIQLLIVVLIISTNLSWLALAFISLLPLMLVYIVFKPRLMI
jgi:UDP-N-acetylmuramyl pentapeptide phosphotransferase/UDP-N-acetylglucosamine-1-phosphate transferase